MCICINILIYSLQSTAPYKRQAKGDLKKIQLIYWQKKKKLVPPGRILSGRSQAWRWRQVHLPMRRATSGSQGAIVLQQALY